MKASLVIAPLVRVVTILSLMVALAPQSAQAQVSFLQPLTFQESSAGSGFPTVYADFNRDGKLDIVALPLPPTPAALLVGNGDDTFKAPINLSVSGGQVATADFNGDGSPDLLVASSTILNILLGNGNGTFQAAKSTDIGVSLGSIVVADVNGDGRPDVLGLAGTQVFVLLGNGDGTFKTAVPYSAGSSPSKMLTGDFNGDGKLDIATAGTGNPGIAVLLGNGDGTFQSPVSSTGVGDPFGVTAADLNGDGKLDLVISDQSTYQTYTFLGNGNGTFQAGMVSASVAGHVGVADLNGDGKADLIVDSRASDNSVASFTEVLLGNGDGTFTYARAYAAAGTILIADFNNDGKLDLAVGNTMLLGNGNGTFAGQPVAPLATAGSSSVVGDFNGDGNPDLAVTSIYPDEVYILLGDGTGSLQVQHTYTLSVQGLSIATGDLNGDGKLDLAIITVDENRDGGLTVMLGNGDGTFGPPTVYQGLNSVGPGANPPVIADLQGDHRPDVMTVQGDSLVVFPNNGDGTFGTPVLYFAGSGASEVVVADFNGDGKLDAAVSSSAGIGILLGNGDGTFQGVTFIDTAATTGIVAGDFNNDGKPDLIVDGSGGWQAFLGNGNGTFTAVPGNLVAALVGLADFNGDGNLDLVESGCPNSTSQFNTWCIQLGNGDGTFGKPVSVMSAGGGITFGFTAVADFNRDGKPDIAIELYQGELGPGALFMLLNTTVPGFAIAPALGSPNSAMVTAGQTASFNLAVTPFGTFSGTVSLSCAITPAVMSAPVCTVPASVNVTQGAAAPVTAKVSTTAGTAGSTSQVNLPRGMTPITWTIVLLASGLLFSVYRRRMPALAIPMVAVAFLAMPGCGGGNSSSPNTTPGTPGGTYTATVTAKSGSLSHNTALTVTVQ